MSTSGKGVYLINSDWASGALVFFEKAVGRTSTGDIFTLSTTAVKVGGTLQDVDFQYYGTGSLSAIIDCGAATFTLTGITSTFKSPVNFGVDGTGVDVTFYGDTASTNMLWDYSADQLVFVNNASINYQVGAAPTNHTPISVGRFVASAASGGGFVVTAANSAGIRSYCEATADLLSSSTVRSVLGRFLNTGNFTQTAECFGVVGQMVAKQAKIQHDSAGVMGSLEAQTTAVTFSGDIGDTCAAGVLGRVGVSVTATTIEADGVVAGLAAMSNITDGYVTVTNGGILAGVYVGAFASKQDWDVGVYVAAATATKAGDINGIANGLYVTATALTATTGRIGKFSGTVAAPNHGDGYGAFEVDITASGTVAGTSAAFSSWLNLASGAVPGGNILCAQNNGIYLPTGITASSAKMIMGMRMQYVADDGANPGSLYCFSTNIYSNVLTAIFDVNAIVDLGGSTGAQAGNDYKIPLFRDATAGQTWYVNVYHS